MKYYKAVVKYYDLDKRLTEGICGFGEIRDLKKIKNYYSERTEIIEISKEELEVIQYKYNRQSYGY